MSDDFFDDMGDFLDDAVDIVGFPWKLCIIVIILIILYCIFGV